MKKGLNVTWKICVGVLSFLQTLAFWCLVLGATEKENNNRTPLIIGFIVILLILNVLDKFLRKEDSWSCVLINVLFAPVRFFTQILGFVLVSKKGSKMERGSYKLDETKNVLVYYLTSIDLGGEKEDLPQKVVLAAMKKIASKGNAIYTYPSGATLKIHTEVTVKDHTISFIMMGDFENFNLIKSQEEFESNKPHVTSILNGISKQIDAQTDKWYKAQNCKAVYDLNIDYVEHK